MKTCVTLLLALTIAGRISAAPPPPAAPLRILCTTFPVYLFTRQVAAGRDAVTVELLLAAGLGCPHDYVLTPADLQALARADVLVINGLGFEEFLGAPLARVNAKVVRVDASAGIPDLLRTRDEDAGQAAPGHAHDGHEHQHAGGVNPHLFASPRQAARMLANIAAGLARADAVGRAVYEENARTVGARLDKLAADFAAVGQTLDRRRVVAQHEVFDYVARDMGLEVAAVIETQPGQEPAASEMLALVKTIRTQRVAAVLTEPQYSAKVGATLAKETGIPTIALDPVASGPADAGLDYYERAMGANLEVLRQTLGGKQR